MKWLYRRIAIHPYNALILRRGVLHTPRSLLGLHTSSPVFGFRVRVLALSVLGGGVTGGFPPSPKKNLILKHLNLILNLNLNLTLTDFDFFNIKTGRTIVCAT